MMQPTDLLEGVPVRCIHPVVGLTYRRHYTIIEDDITRGEPNGGAFGYFPFRFERVV